MHPDIAALCARTDLGLAPHYATIWSMVRGLEAKRTFEFGAGGSTAVILDALGKGGFHTSVSTDSKVHTSAQFGLNEVAPKLWWHVQGLSQDLSGAAVEGPFDFVLHDGSHTEDVVTDDLFNILPHVRTFGLVVVHDTQYIRCREGMRNAIFRVVEECFEFRGMHLSHTTLPYGAGLTIIRVERGGMGEPIAPKYVKDGDPEGRTIPCAI